MCICKPQAPDDQETQKVSLGMIIGSLMSEIIKARRIADEQTAALAEYYKENPLLEGLSVPRIRVPELTMDIPMLIEDYIKGESGCLATKNKIIGKAVRQLKRCLNKYDIQVDQCLYPHFKKKMYRKLKALKQSDLPAMKEAVVRIVQDALAYALDKTGTILEPAYMNAITKALRKKIEAVCIVKKQVPDSIMVNIITADIKRRAFKGNVACLKITLGEEGLVWAIKTDDSGGLEYSLEPE